MRKRQPAGFQIIGLGSVLALSLISAPASTNHEHDLDGPAVAFVALGSVMHYNQHLHHYYHHQHRQQRNNFVDGVVQSTGTNNPNGNMNHPGRDRSQESPRPIPLKK